MNRRILAIIVGALVSIGLTLVSVNLLQKYGMMLFVITPFAAGVIVANILPRSIGRGERAGLAILSQGLFGVGLLCFALEGAICIAMAMPIWIPLTALGSMMSPAKTGPYLSLIFLSPAMMGIESVVRPPAPLVSVQTVIEVNARPEAVWPMVVAFPELPPLEAWRDWYFTAGLAAPLRARIDGEGVGAIRYCEFTTGPFVEPITTWDPPHHLAFDVTHSPPAMKEMSFYEEVHALHLKNNILESKRGEFRLEALPNGRTRLVGTTWYSNEMYPVWYWRLWSDAIIHRIHVRVLEHIRDTVETAPTQAALQTEGSGSTTQRSTQDLLD